MTSFHSLLVATDFSIDGRHAVRRAALLAHEHGAQLRILHVLKPTGCRPLREWFSSPTIDIDLKAAQAHGELQRVALEISAAYGLTPCAEVVIGDPVEVLMEASERADLVVLGRRGHGHRLGLRVGRTVDRMLRTCRRPVLVVSASVEHAYRRILVPIDFAPASDAAIRVAARLRSTRMCIFHAINSQREAVLRDADVPEHIVRESRVMEEAGTDARMRRKIAWLGLDGTSMNFALGFGPAVRATLRHARQMDADLIVAGKQSRSIGFLLGSVSSRVLSGSACDVLIVPRPQDDAAPRAASRRASLLAPQVQAADAAVAESAATRAGTLAPAHWIHNKAHFTPRKTPSDPPVPVDPG